MFDTVIIPNIALSPGISYEQVKLKWTNLATPINDFNGVQTRFPLVSQDNPIAPPSAQHLIVSVYGQVLIPGTDFTLSGDEIVFTTAPRTKLPADDSTTIFVDLSVIASTILVLPSKIPMSNLSISIY